MTKQFVQGHSNGKLKRYIWFTNSLDVFIIHTRKSVLSSFFSLNNVSKIPILTFKQHYRIYSLTYILYNILVIYYIKLDRKIVKIPIFLFPFFEYTWVTRHINFPFKNIHHFYIRRVRRLKLLTKNRYFSHQSKKSIRTILVVL